MTASNTALSDDTLLDRNEIRKRFPHIPTSPNYLRKLVAQGKFPPPIPLSSRRRVWRLSAIEGYIKQREAEALSSISAALKEGCTWVPDRNSPLSAKKHFAELRSIYLCLICQSWDQLHKL